MILVLQICLTFTSLSGDKVLNVSSILLSTELLRIVRTHTLFVNQPINVPSI